ncbi:hypothetical protein GH714_027527 [Hevea brasiliensis]|uniref:Rieske domain-containing protein n=1 Tax=Hevea brasiliensis TaxID=3981 RepID=A0A6A6MLD0_HEVBR|nr:hypothetical protein GH714_027527 [Hevea brasiliensis]
MEALKGSLIPSLQIPSTPTTLHKTQFLNFQFCSIPTSFLKSIQRNTSRSKLFTTLSSSTVSTEPIDPTDPLLETDSQEEKFDWFSQWYPVMPVCDLDKRVPHAKKVIGFDVVVWWDRNEGSWKVFDDTCPHRLAPLSEGRIDQWGRLQCVYHGWCFNGSGDCKFIPQAPPDGPPVHTFKKACVAAYPFKLDREGGAPIDISIEKLDKNGFQATRYGGNSRFMAPCTYYSAVSLPTSVNPGNVSDQGNGSVSSAGNNMPSSNSNVPQQRGLLVFYCVPVSPGRSRLIFIFPRNFGVWIDKIIPRWVFHVRQNLVLDSDLYLLHIEERKIMDAGSSNWQKACFVPTKSDAQVVAFRKWLKKYSDGQINWGEKFSGLPPSPPKEQLMDRYWSHVVNCSSCRVAYKGLNALEVVLQVVSIVSIGIVAATKQTGMSAVARTTLVLMAVLCFAASRWLAHFIYKNFHFHDYNHALL